MPGITNDFGQIELIDTLWNVNADCCQPGGLPMTELIDTLWNVNDNADVDDVIKITN